MRKIGLLITLTLPTTGYAQDRQFRQLTLTDGRIIRAEVLATEPVGLRMRTPQGETLVSFELLMNMVPIEMDDYRDQLPQRVWVYAPKDENKIRSIYESIPEIKVSSAADANGLPPGLALQFAECGPDFDCMEEAVAGADWLWLVTSLPPSDDSNVVSIIRGRASGGPPIVREDVPTDTIEDYWKAAHKVISVVSPAKIPKNIRFETPEDSSTTKPITKKSPAAWTSARVNNASIIPLPGYPSLAQGDGGRFALGAGIALAGTGAIAATTYFGTMDAGKADIPTVGVVSAVGFVALTASMNNVFGHASRKTMVGFVPSAAGGQMIVASEF